MTGRGASTKQGSNRVPRFLAGRNAPLSAALLLAAILASKIIAGQASVSFQSTVTVALIVACTIAAMRVPRSVRAKGFWALIGVMGLAAADIGFGPRDAAENTFQNRLSLIACMTIIYVLASDKQRADARSPNDSDPDADDGAGRSFD